MWTNENRSRYDRGKLRYPSDLTDEEWALIAAVLESKPLLVLDEWAADQDPVFRRKFYETILPSLKRRGGTIVAATHDDRWFHLADRHIRLADGQIQSQPDTPSPHSPGGH